MSKVQIDPHNPNRVWFIFDNGSEITVTKTERGLIVRNNTFGNELTDLAVRPSSANTLMVEAVPI